MSDREVEINRIVAQQTSRKRLLSRAVALSPLFGALSYPFLLETFHSTGGGAEASFSTATVWAGACLLTALAAPALGLGVAAQLSKDDHPTQFVLRARRLAYASVAAPPLFVFAGVALGLLKAPVDDTTVWIVGWLGALTWGWLAGDTAASTGGPSVAGLRVAHGIVASLIAIFVLFHLSNHVLGLLGPAPHAQVMEIGRTVYRSGWIEPILLGLLLVQIALGLLLAVRWSAPRADWYRVVQVGSGMYVAVFLITHLNSALISARLIHGVETDWAWASGAPEGLVHDSWNIRLLPHYAFGAFFVLAHLTTGLRHVLIAHGMPEAVANNLWRAGLAVGVAVSAVIIGALVGLRL